MTRDEARRRIDADRQAHPTAYAAEENKTTCIRCGRELTDPESVKLGIGPECAKKEEGGSWADLGDEETYENMDPLADLGTGITPPLKLKGVGRT